MKIKTLLVANVSFIGLVFAYGLMVSIVFRGKVDGVGFLLMVLIIPQVINIPSLFWYTTLSRVLKLAGDEKNIKKFINPIVSITGRDANFVLMYSFAF